MIGIAPDYPGLGTPGVHPYLVTESEGKAVLDALRATRALATMEGIAFSGRFVVTGLSQGGHATLAAAALHRSYAPDLDIRGFAASGPATVWEEHFRKGIAFDGSHVSLHAMLMYSWSDYYHYGGPSLWSATVAPTIDDVMRNNCVFSVPGHDTLEHKLGDSAATIFSPEFLNAYRSGDWGPYSAFHDAFSKNRVGPYVATAPLKIYQGDADDTVPKFATDEVVAALRAGGNEIDYEIVPGGHHIDVAFGFVAYPQKRTNESIAWVRAELERPVQR
jgi:acetyl esterase/lipase